MEEGKHSCPRRSSSPLISHHHSPVIAQNDITQHPFTIPRSYEASPITQQKYVSPQRLSLDIQQLDLSGYQDRKGSIGARGDGLCGNKILGEVGFEIFYIQQEELLAVSLKHIDKIGIPSPSVIGSRWVCHPECIISLLPEKRLFFDKKGFKHRWTLNEHSTTYIGVKQSEVHDKTLRITVYDAKRNHNYLPIGHVLVPLRDLQMTGRVYPFLKPINLHSNPAGFKRGNIDLSVTWIGSSEELQVRIGNATRLESPRGILGRNFYVKMSVFNGSVEERSFKSALNKAEPDLYFKETFVVPLQSSELRDIALLFFVYAKKLVKLSITSELIGMAVIGPYMSSISHENMTQWEIMIMKPFEEVTVTHTLFV